MHLGLGSWSFGFIGLNVVLPSNYCSPRDAARSGKLVLITTVAISDLSSGELSLKAEGPTSDLMAGA